MIYKNQEDSSFKWFDTKHIKHIDKLSKEDIKWLNTPSISVFTPFSFVLRGQFDLLLVFVLAVALSPVSKIATVVILVILTIFSIKYLRRLVWNRGFYKTLEEYKKSEKKWSSLGIFFLIILCLVFVGNFFNKNNEVNNEFKEVLVDKSIGNSEIIGNMYRNNKYNFRIKFPEGWKIENGDGIHIVQKASFEGNVISVSVQQFDSNMKLVSIKDTGSLKDVTDILIQNVKSKYSTKIIDSGETKIDNEPAYWVKYSLDYQTLDTAVSMTNVIYMLAKNDTMYSISAGTTTEDFSKMKSLFEQSIMTFVIEKY